MNTPLDIVAAAIRESCGCQPPVGLAVPLANVAIRTLTDDRIVNNAVAELTCDLRVTSRLNEDDMRYIARVVLRSVGEA